MIKDQATIYKRPNQRYTFEAILEKDRKLPFASALTLENVMAIEGINFDAEVQRQVKFNFRTDDVAIGGAVQSAGKSVVQRYAALYTYL